MIDSYTATYILSGFLIIFGVLLPILDKIPKVRDFISFRWTIVVIYSAMSIGVIIDFNHLDTSVRFAVVLGGIVLSALFLLIRSLEKVMINKWKFPRMRGKVQKGDVQAELSVNPKVDNEISSLSLDSSPSRILSENSDNSNFEEVYCKKFNDMD